MLESWKKVFRGGVAPLFSDEGLLALKDALINDDVSLIQGATTSPPPLACVSTWECEGACLITYPFWKADGLETVAECEEAFARACYACDQTIGEPAACRHLLNWYDETDREIMRSELLAEVNHVIQLRTDS